MHKNGHPPLEKSPLGESSSNFGWTTTGELDDATDLPSDDQIGGGTAVRFSVISVTERPGLLVNAVFIPSAVELTLPARVGLATAYDRFGKSAKAHPEDSAEFTFAKEARWYTGMRMNDRGLNTFGGLLHCMDGRTGIFFSWFLADSLQYDVQRRDPEDYSHLKRASQLCYEDDPAPRASMLMRLIIGCGQPDEQSFRAELGLPEQETITEPKVHIVGRTTVVAA